MCPVEAPSLRPQVLAKNSEEYIFIRNDISGDWLSGFSAFKILAEYDINSCPQHLVTQAIKILRENG